ncbi:alkaline phosphatase family protein [Haloarcula nitratireducens]|uniref:Alkaline phosphatase family protein n=1 Tax=Haloarcula nitratireducens TaxID=2487749 RepID=A0AAW4PDJ8_9EURY|nr:alkaline phosphatase family protein [Halomicroarcula nitratireducens]MBX0295751.1 alkaline phosphatase family protein [Halomicroarcula nitratireducens]
MTEHSDLDVLLIGIDAGCLSVFDRLNDEGRIPNLASIYEDGVAGPLESQIPPWTPSAWPSLYTGVNPGKHGAYSFVSFDGYDWEVVSRDHVREHSIWELLDDRGKSSVVLNVPVTSPPAEIDGAVVPGFIGPEDPPCHPEGVIDDIKEALGEYRVYPAYTRGETELSDAEKLEEYHELVRLRRKAFSYLLDEYEPDFGFVQFQKTDTVFHEFLGDESAVNEVYETTDEEIGKLLDDHDPDTVIIASDHGMGPYEKEEFRVNEYLRDEGYVETVKGGKGMPSWNPIRQGLREGEDETSWEPNMIERIAATAAKFGLTANRVGAGLRHVGLEEIAKQYAPNGVVRTANEQVDFQSSVAYMRARTELGVRLNVEGREPEGVVPEADYESVRQEIIESLRDATTPDGNPVFDTVAPREDYFEGPYDEGAVDIVTVPRDFDHFLSAQLLGDHFGEPAEPWNHKLEGIIAATGEGIDESASLTDAHLFDVAPTVLGALGVPYSDRMDGTPLPIVDDPGSTTYDAYEEGSAAAATADDSTVEGRLSDLGYLD